VLERYKRIEKVLADQGYQGDLAQKLQKAYHCQLEITKSETKGFVPEKFRWLVARTFAWLENARTLSRDYEQLPENHQGMIYVVLIRLMLRRLTKNQRTRKRKDA
jgi:transposase